MAGRGAAAGASPGGRHSAARSRPDPCLGRGRGALHDRGSARRRGAVAVPRLDRRLRDEATAVEAATRCTCSSCVHRIPRPVTVRVRDEYHGCRSWVEIDRELPFEGTPVMADEEFARAAGSIGMIAGQPEPVPAEPEQLARRAPLRVRRRAVAARMGSVIDLIRNTARARNRHRGGGDVVGAPRRRGCGVARHRVRARRRRVALDIDPHPGPRRIEMRSAAGARSAAPRCSPTRALRRPTEPGSPRRGLRLTSGARRADRHHRRPSCGRGGDRRGGRGAGMRPRDLYRRRGRRPRARRRAGAREPAVRRRDARRRGRGGRAHRLGRRGVRAGATAS